MTTILALRDGDGVVLASDGRATSGDVILTDHVCKWCVHEGCAIGHTGPITTEITGRVVKKGGNVARMAENMRRTIQDLGFKAREDDESKEEGGWPVYPASWILVADGEMALLAADLTLIPADDEGVVAEGSGATAALSAIRALRLAGSDLEPRRLAEIALRVAMLIDATTGGSLFIRRLPSDGDWSRLR